uniref:Uncharacterized protein LOC114325755 n=1 Tax=Diabrotica virgifera virgifera TaxID=50390 RepID=A0A6P7F493_DIAVI
MKSLALVTIVFFAVYQAVSSDGPLCENPDTCANQKCTENLVCSDSQILVQNGGICGCCDDCYLKLYEGQACTKSSPLAFGRKNPKEKCADGLVCKQGKCAKLNS